MKSVALTCVGKLKEKYFSDAAAEYVKRLGRFCRFEMCELADSPYADAVGSESEAIIRSFGAGEYRILCDVGGELISSPQLSEIIDRAYTAGHSTVRFVIGGSCGVDDSVRRGVHKRISFGRVTYPHQLMRVLLLEQVYRAFTITGNLPYHK